MKAIYGAVIALCLSASAQADTLQACNLTMAVIDNDPKGTNVRETPGGKIIATLSESNPQGDDDWIEVHLTAQSGEWLAIDRVVLVGDDRKTIFHGKGYIHRSVLGTASGMINGGVIYADHDVKSRTVLARGSADTDLTFLGCWDDFAKVIVKKTKITGWTRAVCLNQRTTCA